MRKMRSLALMSVGLLALVACAAKNPAQPEVSSSRGSSSKVASSSSSSSSSQSGSSRSSASSTWSSSTQAVVSSSTSSSQESVPVPWTEDKSVQLKDYILTVWGPAMGQTYKAYTPATLGEFFGVPIPDGVLTATAVIVPDLNGQSPELFWSMDGLAQSNQLAVVAVYADSEGNTSMVQHLYLFTVTPDGQGQVWITQQNQGNPENKLYFTETKNEELRNFFTQLVDQPS